jgi:hypothetical protein
MGLLLILLLLSIVFLPRLIEPERLKERILADISKDVGGQVQAQQMEASLFVRPHVTFRQVSLSIPGKVTGSTELLSFYPKIIPLLTGKVEPGKIEAETPRINFTVREKQLRWEAAEKMPFTASIGERLTQVLNAVQSRTTGIVVTLTNGELNISPGEATPFRFQDIKARLKLSPQKVKVNLSCTSNLWKYLNVKARLSLIDHTGRGQLNVVHLQPQSLVSSLFPGYSELLGESLLELGVEFEARGSTDLRTEITGAIPRLTLQRANDDNLVVKGESFKATLHTVESRITVSLDNLVLENPELQAAGEFRWDRDQQRMAMEIEGTGVDVDSTRKAVLAVAGELETTNNICEVIQGGSIPFITFSGQGTSLVQVGETKNFRIEGRITDGKIFIPGFDIALEEVSGDAVISDGILHGKNMSARLGNSTGREGTLKLGLVGEDVPFHLEVLALADLTDVMSLLKRVVRNKSFLEEISFIENLDGRAQGRVVLGESTDSVQARVVASEFNLSAQYKRVPFPVHISGGSFVYHDTEINLSNVKAGLVETSLADICGWFRWRETPRFEMQAGVSTVAFAEIYSCLASSGIAEYMEKEQNVKGTVVLSALNLEGPLLKPQNWFVDMSGEVEQVTIEKSPLGVPLELTGGSFRSVKGTTQQELSLENVMVSTLDSSFKVSGVITDFLDDAKNVDINFQGEVGPRANRWLGDRIDLPPDLRLNAPVSVLEARLVWQKQAETAFTGKIDIRQGPRLSLAIVHNPEELRIKQLHIEDAESRASLGLILKDKELTLSFTGLVTGSTLESLLQKEAILQGKIDGDFQANFLLDEPASSMARGSLSGKELVFEFSDNEPLKVESFSLAGLEKGIRVHSAVCSWGSTRMNVDGKINFSEAGYVLDSALLLDRLEGDRLAKLFQQASSKSKVRKTGKFWDAPVSADLDVTAKEFSHAGLTWSALKAHFYLGSHKIHAVITRADLCGIATPGVVEIFPQDFVLAFKPLTKNRDLASTLNCLVKRKGLASGTFNLEGVLTADKKDDLLRSLDGTIEFVSHDGRLRRTSPSSALQQTFNLLDDAKAFEQEVPDLEKEGFSYETIMVRSTLKKGQLILQEATIEGTGMHLAFLGKVDLAEKKLDLDLLVSPLSTVDMVIGKVPLVSSILGGHLVTIPIKVQGEMKSPEVTPLHPSSVGKELLRLLKRTVTLPVTVVQPLLPEQNQEKRQQEEKARNKQNSQDNVQQ